MKKQTHKQSRIATPHSNDAQGRCVCVWGGGGGGGGGGVGAGPVTSFILMR